MNYVGFKVGNYVYHGKDVHKIICLDIDNSGNLVGVLDIPGFYDTWLPMSKFVPWQPKVGDWCWFFNKDRIPVISKLQEICTDGNRKYFAVYFNGETKFGAYYESCKPFIGVPPNA